MEAVVRLDDADFPDLQPQAELLELDHELRIRRDGVPFVSAGTNLWLEANLDLPRLTKIFSLSAGGESRGEVGIFPALNSQLSILNSPLSTLAHESRFTPLALCRLGMDRVILLDREAGIGDSQRLQDQG